MRRIDTHSSRSASLGNTSISQGEADDTPNDVPNVLSKKGHLKSEGERKGSKLKTTTNLESLTRWETEYEHFAGKNEEGNWFLVVIKKSPQDNSQENVVTVLPFEEVTSDGGRFFKELSKKGFGFLSRREKDQILKSLQGIDMQEIKCLIACRSGWLNGAFVTPGYTVYPAGSPVKIYLSLPVAQQMLSKKFHSSGTLDDWLKEVGRFCKGNTRLMFVISLALVQPLLDLISAELGGFLLYGLPGRGKTTLLIIAGSVWGGDRASPMGYCETWNHTTNNLESVATSYNGMLLALDETRAAAEGSKNRAATLSSAIMRLAGGMGKGRMTDVEGPNSWKLNYLGTTNLPVDDILTAGGEVVDDAYRVRAIDIPLPENGHGIFENLHGFASGEDLSNHLKKASTEQYGTLIRAFLQRLVQVRADDEAGLKRQLNRWRQGYIRRANEDIGSAPGMGRFHERFATVYLGARLAIKFGLLPWTWRELRQAILTCEQDHFRLRAKQAQKDGDGLATLKAYVSAQRSQMPNLDTIKTATEADLDAAPGLIWKEAGELVIGLRHSTLRSILGSKSTVKRVLDRLKQQGALTSKRDGSHLKAGQRQKTLKCGLEYRRYFHVFKLKGLK